jgi:hypothetical protein
MPQLFKYLPIANWVDNCNRTDLIEIFVMETRQQQQRRCIVASSASGLIINWTSLWRYPEI